MYIPFWEIEYLKIINIMVTFFKKAIKIISNKIPIINDLNELIN